MRGVVAEEACHPGWSRRPHSAHEQQCGTCPPASMPGSRSAPGHDAPQPPPSALRALPHPLQRLGSWTGSWPCAPGCAAPAGHSRQPPASCPPPRQRGRPCAPAGAGPLVEVGWSAWRLPGWPGQGRAAAGRRGAGEAGPKEHRSSCGMQHPSPAPCTQARAAQWTHWAHNQPHWAPPTLYRSFSSAGWFCRLGRRADSRPVSVLMLREQCTRYTPAGRGQAGQLAGVGGATGPAVGTRSQSTHPNPARALPCDRQPVRPLRATPRTVGVRLGDVVRLERHNEVGEQGVDGGGVHQGVDGVARAQALWSRGRGEQAGGRGQWAGAQLHMARRGAHKRGDPRMAAGRARAIDRSLQARPQAGGEPHGAWVAILPSSPPQPRCQMWRRGGRSPPWPQLPPAPPCPAVWSPPAPCHARGGRHT